MKRFMFVIGGNGIESWYPVDEQIGPSEYGGTFMGLSFLQVRALSNWDRGGFYMEAEITEEQEETLKQLLIEKKDWLAGKEYVEKITGRNFETETGYENPFDPDWKPDFGPEWLAKHKMWSRRAGLHFLDADEDGEEKIRELKTTIKKVFKELRKEGYLARMNYFCCRNCADSALVNEAMEMEEKGKTIKGCVFYHEQGEECLWENGFVHLYYRNLNGSKKSGVLVKKLGEYLVKKFENAGAIVDWDGDPGIAICLYAW